jgi:hypothetical protein
MLWLKAIAKLLCYIVGQLLQGINYVSSNNVLYLPRYKAAISSLVYRLENGVSPYNRTQNWAFSVKIFSWILKIVIWGLVGGGLYYMQGHIIFW